jgi:hypothetical protein
MHLDQLAHRLDPIMSMSRRHVAIQAPQPGRTKNNAPIAAAIFNRPSGELIQIARRGGAGAPKTAGFGDT